MRRLGRVDSKRIEQAIDGLPRGDVKPLAGRQGEWRLRVGAWRVIYVLDVEQGQIAVLAIRPRGAAYQP